MGQALRLLRQPYYSPILPEEIMLEIISWLPVKHVMRLRCLNKFFNTLIFDPHFVQMHLNKSSQNSQLALKHLEDSWNSYLITVSIPDLLKNQFNVIDIDPYYRLSNFLHTWMCVVGSCNGLLCLIGSYMRTNSLDYWFYFWNPAMRTNSKNFTISFECFPNRRFNFSFGYDNLTRTYKVVAFYVEVKPGCNPKSVVKVFSLGDNSWRDIQCLPVLPLHWFNHDKNNGVHLNGTINWIALHDYNSSATADQYSGVTVDQCVILSLDLFTETYTQLLLPQRFDKVLCYLPKVVVLKDCLCFCHVFEKTHFVIWQMKDFGVQDSWIQLFSISYNDLFGREDLLPLYLSKNGDTLILAHYEHNEAFIYNCRGNNKVKKIENTNSIIWLQARDYVESLVATH